MLCPRCHRLVHDGCVPLRLAYSMKGHVHGLPSVIDVISKIPPTGDEILACLRAKTVCQEEPHERLRFMNDLIVLANGISSIAERDYLFATLLLQKVSILSDGTEPLRRDYTATLRAMQHRRGWANIMAANAGRYASGEPMLRLTAEHCRAVGYNAMRRFDQGARVHFRILQQLEAMRADKRKEDDLFLGRIMRERAVCLAKNSATSSLAPQLARQSFDLATSIGHRHDIQDALIRCCEVSMYVGEYSAASSYLDKLRENMKDLDANLKAITLKLEARLAVCTGQIVVAKGIIDAGLRHCDDARVMHQKYHFQSLDWQIQQSTTDDPRQIILT